MGISSIIQVTLQKLFKFCVKYSISSKYSFVWQLFISNYKLTEVSNMKNNNLVSLIATAGIIAGTTAGCTGYDNARTPAGHEGYVFHDPIFMGKQEFVETQVGPTSTGLVWRQFVENIDMRPDTYGEKYKIVTNKDMNLTFESYARIKLKQGTVKEIVEEFGGEDWFENNVKRPYRSSVREEVRKYDPFEVKNNTEKIAVDTLTRLRERYDGTPIIFESLDIGNIDYPENVQTEINAKVAADQRLERSKVETYIAREDAETLREIAKGKRDSQKIINETLTPRYLQYEAIETYRQLAKSENTTFVVAPTSNEGTGMPLIIGAN
jgi:hypothetical protein